MKKMKKPTKKVDSKKVNAYRGENGKGCNCC